MLSDVPSTAPRTSQSTQSVLVLLLDRQIFLLLQPIPQPGKYYFPFQTFKAYWLRDEPTV